MLMILLAACKVDNGGCSHVCGYNDTTKKVVCGCPDGTKTKLRPDKRTCAGTYM